MKWMAGDMVICTNEYGLEDRITANLRYRLVRDSLTRFIQIVDNKGDTYGYEAHRFERVTMPTDAGSDEYDTIMKSMEIVDGNRE